MQKQCYRNTCRMRWKWINLYAHIRTWGTIYIRSEKLLFYRPRFKICRMPKDNFRHAWWCKYKQQLQVLESEKYRFCIMTTFQKGSFNNYVDRILPFFDPVWTVFTPWAWTKTDIFNPLPPYLVHVVIEWPQIQNEVAFGFKEYELLKIYYL